MLGKLSNFQYSVKLSARRRSVRNAQDKAGTIGDFFEKAVNKAVKFIPDLFKRKFRHRFGADRISDVYSAV